MRSGQLFGMLVWAAASPYSTNLTFADDTLYRYDADVVPYDPSAGWIIADPCIPPCSASLGQGNLSLLWSTYGELACFHRWIAGTVDASPPSLWVEWRFRSNNPIPRTSFSCDASIVVDYRAVHQGTFMFADAAVSFSGDDFRLGLDANAFKTFRFESINGSNFTVAVDGEVLTSAMGASAPGSDFVAFCGLGGCNLDINPRINEWDFVRYGTIAFGEKVVSSNPPAGSVDARKTTSLDRFTVTFDSANYVYVSDIAVETTGGPVPVVTATRRLDNGEPETVEIVLDRPIPLGETTRFTMTDGVAVNMVEFTYAPGDANGNGRVDLFDAGVLQNCFGMTGPTGLCAVSDLTRDGAIDLADHALLASLLDGA